MVSGNLNSSRSFKRLIHFLTRLNKVPEPVQTASAISPTSIGSHGSNSVDMDTSGMFASKNLAQVMSYCDANIQPRGSAKKRWLRQAISEDHSCDSPSSRPGRNLLLKILFKARSIAKVNNNKTCLFNKCLS